MGDDVRAQAVSNDDPMMARNLRRIADALGVPVSDFYGSAMLDREATALLTLVQIYFAQVDPDARERFMGAVQVMNVQPVT